jgi:mannose-6-phosphate isomerase-like protein (cupin superfamily)
MERITSKGVAAALVLASLAMLPLSAQAPPQPLSLPLACAGGDCPLLEGVPQTAGMRSGYVRLKPGESVGWHTTGKNEEALVILHGAGEARIEGREGRTFTAPRLVYIPPATRHNIVNTGDRLLEYVYVVAPTAGAGNHRH